MCSGLRFYCAITRETRFPRSQGTWRPLPRVERCVSKALDLGVTQALADLPGRGRRPAMTQSPRLTNYLEVHAVAQELEQTFCFLSWVLVRPAAMSARPRRMDAMMRNSSVISSQGVLREPLESVHHGLLIRHGLDNTAS